MGSFLNLPIHKFKTMNIKEEVVENLKLYFQRELRNIDIVLTFFNIKYLHIILKRVIFVL